MRRVFRTRCPGISMVEALVAVRSSTDTAHLVVARGLAEQAMDKIAAVRFPDGDIQQPSPTTRENFDDIDDYNGWSSSPVQSRNGRALGPKEMRQRVGQSFGPPACPQTHVF